MRRCEWCNAVLASTSRPDRRYCRPACATASRRRRNGERPLANSPELVALPTPEPSELELALARALDPQRLLAVVAAHANARAPTSWRAALALISLQAQQGTPLPAPPPSPEQAIWDEIDEIARRRRGRQR